MTAELTALVLAALLQCLQFLLVAIPANRELGPGVTMGPRDDGPLAERVSPRTARLARALQNHFEGLILFAIAVTAVTLGDAASTLTAACAWIYLAARILYVPAYYCGLSPWRSCIWSAGWLATVVMLVAALL
ncbi:MAPEG family protein [Mangrovicoccus algicola]|uniref:MAPEG family protein n=1 Tax=Mangrovicoccus algicola TaxID=2771008 RepID=A0A8J6YSH5_9RHOB|nr:MAPEG family protein [Mangrovicoccus algicola]MBE3636700.1 MAPEG family protein [Mangrovicoccus algicola]